MTLQRRQEDLPGANDVEDVVIHLIKQTALMLISAIRFFADDYEDLNGKQFKQNLDEESQELKGAFTSDEVIRIHERLKGAIFQQGRHEKEYRQKQLEEYTKIVDTLLQGLNMFARGNRIFTDRLDEQLGRMQYVVELDNLTQIRVQLTKEIGKAKQMVEEKRQQDETQNEALLRQVKTLNAQLDIAKEEGRIDGLTGTYNRRALDNHVLDELNRARTIGGTFGIMLFDIDSFKNVNDEHGHPVGDRLLKAVAQHAKHSMRAGDFVARYGGDEFAIVLQGRSSSGAYQALERFRSTVVSRTFRYPKPDGTTETLRVSISGGIAWFRESDTIESLIYRADQTLYLAKKRGKNRICTDDELDAKV